MQQLKVLKALNCKPIDEEGFEKIRHLVPYKTLYEFYHRDK